MPHRHAPGRDRRGDQIANFIRRVTVRHTAINNADLKRSRWNVNNRPFDDPAKFLFIHPRRQIKPFPRFKIRITAPFPRQIRFTNSSYSILPPLFFLPSIRQPLADFRPFPCQHLYNIHQDPRKWKLISEKNIKNFTYFIRTPPGRPAIHPPAGILFLFFSGAVSRHNNPRPV